MIQSLGVIGRQGEETLNRNGLRLLGLCPTNTLVILNTFFQHKAIHKFTWESRGRSLRSIIDYFIVGRELRPGVEDVRVIRGAEVGSDHYLVLLKVRLQVKRRKKCTEAGRSKLRVHRLENRETRWKFQQELSRKFKEANEKSGDDIEKAWKEFRFAVIEVAQRVVGRSRNKRQRKATAWWSEEVKEAVKRKKELYRKALNEKTQETWETYKKASKEAKRVVREAKERDWIRMSKQLQKNFMENKHAFWKKVKSKEGRGVSIGIESKDGTVLMGEE